MPTTKGKKQCGNCIGTGEVCRICGVSKSPDAQDIPCRPNHFVNDDVWRHEFMECPECVGTGYQPV